MLDARSFVSWLTLVIFRFPLFRRVALHKYDPPDLVTNSSTTEQSKEASAAMTTPAKKTGVHSLVGGSPALEDTTPISMGSPEPRSPISINSRNLDFDEGDDSDDDLL